MISNGGQHTIEENLQWKTTSNGRRYQKGIQFEYLSKQQSDSSQNEAKGQHRLYWGLK